MKKITKKFIAAMTSFCMLCSGMALPFGAFADNMSIVYGENTQQAGAYSCDFMQLVKNSANTAYGTNEDTYVLDEYTTAILTYADTYVSADGKVYLKSNGPASGNGKYKNGSHIKFVAPADGTMVASGSAISLFDGETYTKKYGNSLTYEVKKDGVYYLAYRSGSTYVSSLTFTPAAEPTPEPTTDPAVAIKPYSPPSTIWDFDNSAPETKGYNIPVVSGTASWDTTNKNIKFESESTASGSVDVTFRPAVKSSIDIAFDAYIGKLGSQMFSYSITDSEGNELVSCQVHPYGGDDYTASGLFIGGVKIADDEAVRNGLTSVNNDGMSGAPTKYDTRIDFNAKTVVVSIGTTVFSGTIPESVTGDIANINVTGSRSKSAAGRICYLDNIEINEFVSEEPVSPPTVTEGYLENVYADENGTMPYRYYIPSDYDSSKQYPVLMYLHGESRKGSDNAGQLYNASYMFDKLKGNSAYPCILVAPQCSDDDTWVNTEIESGTYDSSVTAQTAASKLALGVLEEIQNHYSVDANRIYLAGQSLGAYGCWDMALRNPDKFAAIIPIAGGGSTADSAAIAALAQANVGVWAFHGYADTTVPAAGTRAMINALQSAAATDVRYTEFTFGAHGIAEEAASSTGLYDWLFAKSLTSNADAKNEERIVDLAIFMGQSNMSGRGEYKDAVECLPGHGYEFHSVTSPNVLTTVSEPFGKYENNTTINDNGSDGKDRRSGDLVSSFMENYYQAGGVPLVGVQCSRGGTATSYWTGASVLAESAARYDAAKTYLEANGYTVRHKFMVWCQGEADADSGTAADTYKSRTKSVFDYMKVNTGLDNMFIIKTGHYNINYGIAEGAQPSEANLEKDSGYRKINEAQKALADENSDITEVSSFYTDEYLQMMKDQYHYHQTAYNEVGAMSGYNTAVTYDPAIGAPIPVPAPEPTSSPNPTQTPPPTEQPEVSYSWEFETDQTAASGNNVPVVSGSAAWDAVNKNIKFDANVKTAGAVTVNFDPKPEGVVTTEFDLNIGSLGGQFFTFEFKDSGGNTAVSCTFDIYRGTSTLTIGGETVASGIEINRCMTSITGDGMSAGTTRFKTEINYAKRTAAVTIAGSSTATFTGMIPADYTKNLAVFEARTTKERSADRSIYLDNLSVNSYMPGVEMYATGASSVTKRIGMDVKEQYELSKTYIDDTEAASWSVSGVDGVTIDSATGMLTVAPTAKTGTAVVTATLTTGGTLPAGTAASCNVEIKDFAPMASYTIAGATTLETGKHTKFTVRQVLDSDNNNIAEYTVLRNFNSSDPSVVSVSSEGEVTAVSKGTATVTFDMSIDALNQTEHIKKTIRVGQYEITSSDEYINISSLMSYDTNTYRMYSSKDSYITVTAENGSVHNTTGGQVTVVADYKFEFTDSIVDGYVDVGIEASKLYAGGNGYGLKSASGGLTPSGYRMLKSSDLPFMIDLPDGYYDITFTKTCSGRAELFCNGMKFTQNGSPNTQNRTTYPIEFTTEQVKVESGVANISIANTTSNASDQYIATLEFVKVPNEYRQQHIFLAGDSTVANYFPVDHDGDDLASNKIMMTGWGMQLDKYLSDNYVVTNLAEQGRYAQDWYEDSYEEMLYQMEAGDTLLINFGINDGNKAVGIENSNKYITQMVERAAEKGVNSILISPVYNRKYNHKTYYNYDPATGKNAAADLAETLDVPFIDLNKYTRIYLDADSGNQAAVEWITNNYHIADSLHLSQHSALLCASFIAAGMSEIGYHTTDFAYTYKDISETVVDGSGNAGYLRGTETGITRLYSVNTAREFMGLGSPEDRYPVKLEYEKASKKITATASTPDITAGVLIKAEYNEKGGLESVIYKNMTFGNYIATAELELKDGDTVLLWDSFESMNPLAEKYVYTDDAEPPIPTPTPTAAPVVLYSENFESYHNGDKGGWTSPAGTIAIATDTVNSQINKYLTLTSGKSGTARSAYKEISPTITENFVLEADFKSSYYATNVSNFEILDTKSSHYANHGCYSNGKYIFKMNRPKGMNQYVINNKVSDSGLGLSAYDQPAVLTNEIQGDPWLHVRIVGDYSKGTVIAYITSLDGKTEYYHGMTDMSEGITSFKCLALLVPSSGYDTCIDNIKVTKATAEDLKPVYHTVKINDFGEEFSQYVLNSESVVNIPDVSIYGDSFLGWKINDDTALYTSEQLSKLPITSDSIITSQVSSSYVEELDVVEFNNFPVDNSLVMGADGDTYADNIISLTIKGNKGTSIVTNPDPKVTDYQIDWEFIGFRTMDGRPTYEEGASYCDSYGKCEITEKAQTSVNFQMKNTAANYYGMVKATVTYNGKSMSVSKPLLLFADTNQDASILLPKAGYCSDYNKYDEGLTGYTFSSSDVLTGGWSTDGSDSKRISMMSDATGRFLRLSRDGTGNSAVGHNHIGEINGQTIFEQDVRFNIDGNIAYIGGSTTAPTSTAFSLALTNSKFTFNGEHLCAGTNQTWYHIVICADNTTKKCWAKIYAYQPSGVYSDSNLLGESEITDFAGDYASGTHYAITPARKSGSIDFNNVQIKASEIDETTFTVTPSKTTANIPDAGSQSVTVDLTVSVKTTEGYDAIGLAEWTINDEFADGVMITPHASDSHKAILTIDSNAASGELPVKVTIGRKSVVTSIKLLGTKDNVAFVAAPLGAMIPDSGSAEYTYKAVVRNGNAEELDGKTITYQLYDSTNTNAVSTSGVTLDASTGILAVASTAEPMDICIRAESTDGAGIIITKAVKISIYNLKFDFGAYSAIASGYVPVTASTVYNESRGYGIEGTVSEGAVSGSTDKRKGDYITGSNFTFKAKVENGQVYNVKICYSGAIKCERIDSNLSGFDKSSASLAETTFKVAVVRDGILDINFSGEGQIASIEISKVAREKQAKPDWWTIGDSTIQQNGSWAYTITNNVTTDLSKYPELAKVVNGFHNSGQAGRQHKSYYAEGLLNNVLCSLKPGDVVSISGMGTNDSLSTKEQFKQYNNYYIDAILDMGGYVILGSYTPTGNYNVTKDKVYDADTMTFKGMRTNSYETAIREVYEERKHDERILGFLDIGKMSDEMMTADVQKSYHDAVSGGVSEIDARAAANARAEEMMGWWKDYNHYYVTFSNYILPTLTQKAAELIANAR